MPYYQTNHYQQSPPPQQPHHDPYAQYSPQQGQNGGHTRQYGHPQHQPAYPGQPTYDHHQGGGGGGGGPVQQPSQSGYQDTYQSPRSTTFGAGYGGQQQYQAQGAYNPAQFSPPQLPHQPIQQYDPRAYAQPIAGQNQSQYNPAAYSDPPASTSGPLGMSMYNYSPSTSSAAHSPPLPQHSPYAQSPHTNQQPFSPQLPYRSPPAAPQQEYHQPTAPQRSYSEYGYHVAPTASGHRPTQMPYPGDPHGRQHAHSVGVMQISQAEHYQVSPNLPALPDDQLYRPSPPQHQLSDSQQSSSSLHPSTSNVSLPSPTHSTPGPTPPAHSGFVSRSDSSNRHPQARPLPGPPEPDTSVEYFHRNGSRSQLTHEEAEALSQEELFNQVEDAVLRAGSGPNPGTHSPSISVSQPPYPTDQPSPLFASNSSHDGRVQRNGSVLNGHLSGGPPEPHLSDESDAEAAQGLAMMRMAEEDEVRRRSRTGLSGYGSQRNSRPQHLSPHSAGLGSESDENGYGTVDMSSFGGGYDVQMSYGGTDPSQLTVGHEVNGYGASPAVSSQHSSMRRSNPSQSSQVSGEYDYRSESLHPFPPFNPAAQVDMSGTGGLSEPTGSRRRPSYDEGDEYALMEGQLPERFPDEPPDIFFQQASTSYTSRPLPPVPGQDATLPPLQTDMRGQSSSESSYYPQGPGAYVYNAQGQYVPRSTSLISHQITPQVAQPLRSKTDAEERRLRLSQYRTSMTTPASEFTTPSTVVPDLPSLGAKRFVPSKLGATDFRKCEEPWSLMAIQKWLLTIVAPEQYTELKEAEVKEALVALFTNKVPTMNIADAEGLSNHVVSNMYAAGALVTTEEWVKLVPGPMSGVIFQLSGAGCYSPTLHDHIVPGRCYSHHCQRTLKKVNLQTQPNRTGESWTEFYHLTKEDLEGRDKKELERQNILHEIVQTEDIYMEQLNVLRNLYRDKLASFEPSIIAPKRKEKFLRDVFGRVDAVKQANEDHLLPQLKYRQQEQGPWIVGFSEIFRQWIRKAKTAYLDYAGGFPGANFLVRQELDRNLPFRNFIEQASKDKRSNRLQWDTFLKAPITRLQRYTLLISSVLKCMKTDSEEKKNLQLAFDEVKGVTLECDARVAEMQRKVDLSDLSMKLVLRPGMQRDVELNLDHFGRELIHRGDLTRTGGNRFTFLDAHCLLFDHYLVLAKSIWQRDAQGGRLEKYDVSRLPIPMDLLILESTNDPPVQKSSYVKGISSVTAVTGRTASPADPSTLGRSQSNQIPPGSLNLQHVNTGNSSSSLQTVTSLGNEKDSERILWPLKIKHLGRETYNLFAHSDNARREWVSKILEAKTKHAAALYAQHAEPFRLRVMADSAFVFDAFGTGAGKSMVIKGTPIDRAVREVEHRFKDTGRPGPICRARVNCATSFWVTEHSSHGQQQKQLVAVGTDFGVYICDVNNPRGWARAIQMSRVTQISVLEDFNLFLLISDKSLIAYHLDVVVPNERNGPPTTNDAGRKAPQKLSGSKDVGFFVSGRMKDRQLVFYKKRENLASVFKVLEPVYQKSTERRRAAGMGMFKRGNTEFFRDYDEFYIPAECSGMSLFQSSLAVSTARGFEVMILDKKQPWTVPELKQEGVQNFASHIKDLKPLVMLRLSDQEFLLVYTSCALYVNKHGEVSRGVIMEFVGNAQSAALYGAYLILFDSDFVEIRNASNGRLKQIIPGREIKCLDDGGSCCASGSNTGSATGTNGTVVNGAHVSGGQRTVKFVMQHPESEKTQIVMELLLNENMKE